MHAGAAATAAAAAALVWGSTMAPALAFGPVSVALNEIQVQEVPCKGANCYAVPQPV